MYISKIKVKNFRNFKDFEVNFNDGINVIIGSNNSGKSNLLKTLAIIFDSGTSKKLEMDDFCKYIDRQEIIDTPPKISIEITITKSNNEKEDVTNEDLSVIANWLTKLEDNYEAKLTYEFFLPEKFHDAYKERVKELELNQIWKVIKQEYLRFYTYKIWAGELENFQLVDSESLQKFDFQFLDAIRDVERDMFSGKNTLLKDILDFFLDYDIKTSNDHTDVKKAKLKAERDKFAQYAKPLIENIDQRIQSGKSKILQYIQDTGASFKNLIPNFEGEISETEIYNVLRLIVEHETGEKIPVTHNGLGYNNLIFMSLLLAKMQVNTSQQYLDNNAKVYSLLLVEEPEAHLHPSMQYKFLKFLSNNIQDNQVRQIFITSHSTHITLATSLDNIICLYTDSNNQTIAGYPAKTFEGNDSSKKYVERFLDAVKSDMLFAERILLVEGIAEQLLIPAFAQYLDKSLEDHHVSVINVGGRYFKHFLQIFDKTKNGHLPKTVVCITDTDPTRKKTNQAYSSKCYPYEFNVDPNEYTYTQNPFLSDTNYSDNISIHTQIVEQSSTFEYELVFTNPAVKLLITNSTKNNNELKTLMDLYVNNAAFQELSATLKVSSENERIKISLANNSHLDDDTKKKALIASRYLNSVAKGENALELSVALLENLNNKGTSSFIEIKIPNYIEEAINKLCV